MNLACCSKPVKTGKKVENGKTTFAVWCEACGRRGHGGTTAAAEAAFKASKPAQAGPPPIAGLPAAPDQLPGYVAVHLAEITAVSAAFVEKPALLQMVKRNVRYVVNNKAPGFLKLWGSPEGQESIIRALEDAFSLGATLPEMGSIVPFGATCEFIPAVECYEFALTQGRAAPFAWINIEAVYKNDLVEVSRKNGNFEIAFKSIPSDRGEVIALAVYGAFRKGNHTQVVGELYDADRLLEKARQHSPSYQSYLRNLTLFEQARTEGRVKIDAEGRQYADVLVEAKEAGKYADRDRASFEAAEKAGVLKKDAKGEYAEVQIPKKGNTGETWTKKIYRSSIENPGTETKRLYLEDIINPYDGPDRPEMLRKAAGKSFLNKYVKVRNSVAAMDDLRREPATVEDALDGALDQAFRQFEGGGGAQRAAPGGAPQSAQQPAGPAPQAETVEADFELVSEEPPAEGIETKSEKSKADKNVGPLPKF